jgi:hypothetical protein
MVSWGLVGLKRGARRPNIAEFEASWHFVASPRARALLRIASACSAALYAYFKIPSTPFAPVVFRTVAYFFQAGRVRRRAADLWE